MTMRSARFGLTMMTCRASRESSTSADSARTSVGGCVHVSAGVGAQALGWCAVTARRLCSRAEVAPCSGPEVDQSPVQKGRDSE